MDLYNAGGTFLYPQLEREYGVKRSTYYKARVCVPSNRQKEYETFSRKVKQVFEDSKGRYGAVPDNKENILNHDFEAETINQKLKII